MVFKKIFIDTNIFLDLYRQRKDNKEIFDLLSNCNDIIITKQVIREFKRNRIKLLKELLVKIENKQKSINNGLINIESVAILQDDIDNINDNNAKLLKTIKDSYKVIIDKIKNILEDDSSDEVVNTFNKIIINKNTIILDDNDECYNRALKRNKLGEAPRSDKSGKTTICDEYIWETLLTTNSINVLFVTRDNTYYDNKEMLMNEFKEKTGKKIEFYNKLSDAFSKIGKKVSREAKKLEKEEVNRNEELYKEIGNTYNRIRNYLAHLPQTESDIIKMRLGLDDGIYHNLRDVANALDLTKSEIVRKELDAFYRLGEMDIK